MKYRNLGRSGLKVSTLCLGTMTFGEADENSFMHGASADEETSFAIMDRALEAGVNFWDTADVYGQGGLSERVLGRWFEATGRREEVVLATKFRFKMHDGPNGTGASRGRIMKTIEASLRRLKTDHIDLYQIHMQDMDTPEDEILRALDDLITQGKVRYIGASNYAAYRLMESLWTSERERLHRFVSFQPQYSLICRDIEREHVPLCARHGLGIINWSPLAGGFLTGKYRQGEEAPTGSRMSVGTWKKRYAGFDTPSNWKTLAAVKAVAAELGATMAQVALAWAMARPQVTSVIFGARTVAQLDDNVKAADLALTGTQMDLLNAASKPEFGYPYEFIAGVHGGRW